MRVLLAIGAFCAVIVLASGTEAGLVVNSSAGPGIVDTSGGPVTVTFNLSFTGVPAEQVSRYVLGLQLIPGDAGVNFTPAIAPAAGSPTLAGSPPPQFSSGSSFAVHGADAFFASTEFIGSSTPIVDVKLTLNQAETGTFDLYLVDGSWWEDENSSAMSFSNAFIGGLAPLASLTAVPEAGSFIFCGVVSSVGGFVAWRRRRAQAAA